PGGRALESDGRSGRRRSARRGRAARGLARLVPDPARGGHGAGRHQDARRDRRLSGLEGSVGGAFFRRALGGDGGPRADVLGQPRGQVQAAVRRLPRPGRAGCPLRRRAARPGVRAPAMKPGGESRPWRRLGLRREILILLPVALLLLVVLSTFTLFSYRNALSLLTAERQQEAARLARLVAEHLAATPGGSLAPDLQLLRESAPTARAVALVDGNGAAVAAVGDPPGADLLAPAAGRPLDRPRGVGPDEGSPETVTG